MKQGEYRFNSYFNGDPVYYFTDYYGRIWLATNKWSLFRVAALQQKESE